MIFKKLIKLTKNIKIMEKKKQYKEQLAKNLQQKEFFQKNQNTDIKPTDLQKKYVYDIYDKIAPHFSHTRYKAWPKIEKFLQAIQIGSLVLDVGCGNGKYLGVNNKNLFMIGTDRSQGLLQTARGKDINFQLFAADSLQLPVRSDTFDYAISIAVIHHFSNDYLRHQALNEIIRVMKSKGRALIYVWAFEQEQRKFLEQDVFVPWNLQFKFEGQQQLKKIKESGIKQQFIDQQKRTVVYKRYYHVFKQKQLQKLLEQHKNIKVLESFYDHANWCVIIQKI